MRLIATAVVALTFLQASTMSSTAQGRKPKLAFIYQPGETSGPSELLRALDNTVVSATVFAPGAGGVPLSAATDLSTYEVVFIDLSTPKLESYEAALVRARAATRVVTVGSDQRRLANVSTDDHPWIAQYWRNASQDNYRRLASYLARLAGAEVTIEPPIEYPDHGFYHPDAPGLFRSIAEFESWRGRPSGQDSLTIGLYFHLSVYQQKNVAHVDAVIRAIERRGQRAVAMAFRSNPQLNLFVQDGTSAIDALMFVGAHYTVRDRDAAIAASQQLGVPILGAYTHLSFTPVEYATSVSGLHPSLTPSVVDAEQEGRIEPMVIAAKGSAVGDRWLMTPLPKEVEWRVDRALAWARLHRLANRQKRVVFTYWSEGGGKANIGGDPDDFLDVPGTLVRLLARMRERGYDVGEPPTDAEALANRMARSASNIGTWAPAELDRRAANGELTLVPESTYRRWYNAVPEARRLEIESMWGPPPGKVMVHTDARGDRFIAIPAMTFGNILVAPHPDWGYLQDSKALTSTGALPPHHQYLAFFLWLQHEWRANAWVSLFTNLSLQGGKSEGPAADDHVAILLGSLPQIHPERLGSNGGPANKRKILAQTTGWYNLVRAADTQSQFFTLRAALSRFAQQQDAAVRSTADSLIRDEARRTGLDRLVGEEAMAQPLDDLVATLNSAIERIDRALGPNGSRILGQVPEGEELVSMAFAMAAPELRAAVSSRPLPSAELQRLVAEVVLDQRPPSEAVVARFGRPMPEVVAALEHSVDYANRLRAAPREVEAVLEALDGRFIEPGPLDDPVRRPAALPPGRSLYAFDQAAIPTPEAESAGIKQAEAMIADHRRRHNGAYPGSLAFVLWTSEIAKNNGVVEAQILHLLGTKAVRNERGEVTGVELLPRESLGRPRVDVLITASGTYRDHYQDKIALIAQATRLAASSPEDDNPVASATRTTEARLKAEGESAERAEALARARVFAPAVGAYSPGIQFLAKSGDQRGDEARMAELYTSRMSHAYGDGLEGASARGAFEQHLSRVDAATLSRSGHVNGMLEEPMPAGFLGGINLASKALTGKNVELLVNDLRDAANPRLLTAASAIQQELQTRYFNAGWLKRMQQHGYDGARTMMLLTDNLDLWDSTATNTVSSADWSEVKRVYVEDELGLGMDAFFDRYNPHAQQVLLANLLGAASRGHWQATAADLAQVAGRLARSAAAHGAVCEASICRNPALTRLVERTLGATPEGRRLAAAYRSSIDRAVKVPSETLTAGNAPGPVVSTQMPADPPANANTVTGQVMEERSMVPEQQEQSASLMPWLAGAACLTIAAGFLTASRD
ncbi:MAG TPA: cobaltochelatase subunit CobN [Vicinamibacterales bacterium]|nr:cobaltochelatase subunit CobN [Vicinamibacterales bacterium]